jgi:hypothetical protein
MRTTYRLIMILALLPCAALAQSSDYQDNVKINLSSLVLSNLGVSYERSISHKWSVGMGVRYMPMTSVPFKTTVSNLINDGDIDVQDARMGNIALTPEIRYYLGAARMHGFYIGVYGRYADFGATVPVSYATEINTETAQFTGHIHSFSGGLLFGAQYYFFDRLTVDIWIVGAAYGGSSGNLNAININPPLDAFGRQTLQQNLDDIDVKPFTVHGEVTSSTTAVMTVNGPWAGVRAAGINLGVRF